MSTKRAHTRSTPTTTDSRSFLRWIAVLVILLLVCFASEPRVFADGTDPVEAARYRDGIVLMAFRDGIQPNQQKEILSKVGAREIKQIGVGVHVLAVTPGQVWAAVNSLKEFREVRYAEPDYLQKISAGTLPNDTNVGLQWAHLNTGHAVNGTVGTPGADERTHLAWGITTGTNSVVVAVLDTGVQYSHPDLFTNMWNNPGGVGGCPAGTHGYNVLASTCDPMDDETAYGGHGTHVAGIIGAVGNDAMGTAGVNWTTSIMAVKWVNSGDGTGANSDLVTAMDWVLTAYQAGVNVRVVNDSQTWAGVAFSQAVIDQINALGNSHILFVTASGNTAQDNDTTPRYPCSYGGTTEICVAASDQTDNLWSQANYGPNSVQLAAPGVNIYSTLDHSNYGYISGGSMASPQVAGAAALILSLGYQSASGVRNTILTNVDVLASLNNLVSTKGRLNVCAAIPGCVSAVPATLVNTAAPVVTSFPQQGGLLGASTGFWQGIPAAYTYQWNRCNSSGLNCALIPGATGQAYAPLSSTDVQSTFSVRVTASNAFGSASSTSSPSGVVASVTSAFALASSISSGSTIGGTVSWTITPAQGVQFVQFYIDGALVDTESVAPYTFHASGAAGINTNTLTNTAHVLGARALATDNRTYVFYAESISVWNGPVNTALPAISGNVVPGQILSTSNGTWTGNPTIFAYAWQHCDTAGANCSAISGAANSTYTLSGADSGFTVRSSVTATNYSASFTVSSIQTGIVPSIPMITSTALPNGKPNSNYSANLAVAGGTAPFSWLVISGSLPPGLNLSTGSGLISGVPTVTGTSFFTVQVTDANLLQSSKALSITVSAVNLIQMNAVQGTGVASVSVTFPSANSAGNLILAFVRMSSSSQTVTLHDSAGNTFAHAVGLTQNTDGSQIHLYYAPNIVGAIDTVTATFSSTNNHPWLAIYEYSGLNTMNPLDQTATAQGNSTAPSSGATPTTTSANELVFAATGLPASYAGTVTAGGGYAMQASDLTGSPGANETEIVNSTGSFNATFGLSSSVNWSAIVATFAGGGGGVGPTATNTAVSSSPNPSTFGQSVTFTATVTSGSGVPAGTVTFSEGATTLASNVAVNGSGQGTFSTTVLAVGSHTITASFTGASGWQNSSGTATTPQLVQGSTAASVTSSPNPSTLGQSVTFTATVTSGAGVPVGTVTFTEGATTLASNVAVNGSGQATFSTTTLASGSNTITASFTGANGWQNSSGNDSAAPQVVQNGNATATTITSSPNPSTFGQSVTFTATVTSGAGVPSGTVTFTEGATTLASNVALNVSGKATFNTTTLAVGSHTITASFTGASGWQNSSGNDSAAPQLVQGSTATSVTSSPNPSTFGQSVTFTATVSSGAGVPTGTVTFTEGVATLASNVAVNGSGNATFNTTTLAIGSHTITASFTGTNGWQNSSGNDSAAPQVVQAGTGNPITLVQAKAVQGSGVASMSVAFPSANSAGNLILAFVRMSTSSQTVALQDSAGNTYTQAVAQVQNSDGSQVHLFYARNIAGGANSITATFSSTNNHPWLAIYEYSGLNTTNPLDQTAGAQGNSAAASSGATPTTTSANELVFAATGLPASYAGTVTAGGGYAMQASDLTGSTGANETEIVNSTGSFTATFGLSSSVPWSAIVATFKQ